jgi:membrane protein DedA with SNARE-associated domain
MISTERGIRVVSHIVNFISTHGNIAIFILMTLESACIPIPSEAVMPYGGYLAYVHTLSFWPVVIIGTLANVVGGLIAYYVGYYGGRPLIRRYGRYILLSEKHLSQSEAWFQRYGEWTVLIARMLPAFRTVISLPAGIAKMSVGRFIVFSALGSLPWNFALTLLGFELGKNWDVVEHHSKPLTYIGVAVIVLILLYFWFGRRGKTGMKTPHES